MSQEIQNKRLTSIKEKCNERAYVVTMLGQDHVFAHVDIRYLLTLIDQQEETIKDIKRHLGEEIAGLDFEINSLKYCLNPAIKALKEIETGNYGGIDCRKIAIKSLDEIRRTTP